MAIGGFGDGEVHRCCESQCGGSRRRSRAGGSNRDARQILVNGCASTSGLPGQGSLILVNFSVLPESVNVYLPRLVHAPFSTRLECDR